MIHPLGYIAAIFAQIAIATEFISPSADHRGSFNCKIDCAHGSKMAAEQPQAKKQKCTSGRLSGKTVFMTAAAQGIGRASASVSNCRLETGTVVVNHRFIITTQTRCVFRRHVRRRERQ